MVAGLMTLAIAVQVIWVAKTGDSTDSIIAITVVGVIFGLIAKIATQNDKYFSGALNTSWKVLVGGLMVGGIFLIIGCTVDRPWLWVAGAGFVLAESLVSALQKAHPNKCMPE